MNKIVLFILLFNFWFLISQAQFDTEFWFAAPEVSEGHGDRPIFFRVTSAAQASTVTITQPANPTTIPVVVNLAPFSTAQLNATQFIDIIENKPPNQVLNYGIKITATEAVSVYYEVSHFSNPDIFALKGRNALGTHFFIPMQNIIDNVGHITPPVYASFDIIATEDSTVVVINPSNHIFGHNAGVPFTIFLNEGQTYSATALSHNAALRLHGSQVTSNKPIAVTIKDDSMSGIHFGGYCFDLGGDQIVPVDIIGTEYIPVKGFLNPPHDKVFILATQNNTDVFLNGTLVTTLNAGQTHMYAMDTANAAFIQTSDPVYVLHLSGFGCEVGLSILPTIECTGSSQVTFTRATSAALHITLLVKQGGEGNFLLNSIPGLINSSSFNDVPSTGGLWKYAQISFSTTEIPVNVATQISNTSHTFHLGIIHGTISDGCRFGYFSDFASYKYKINTTHVELCAGDSLVLEANTIQGSTYQWTGPNNFTSQGQILLIDSVTSIHEGVYTLSGFVGNCVVETDSIFIKVNTPYEFNDTAYFCEGNSYFWQGQLYTTPGIYYDSLSSFQGCDSVNILNLYMDPRYEFNQFQQICQGEVFHWQGQNMSTPGVFYDSLTTVNGCDSIFRLELIVLDMPNSHIDSTQILCFGESVTINASGGDTYLWSHGGISNSIIVSPQQTTTYTVTISNNNGCSDVKSTIIEVYAVNPQIGGNSPVCSGEAMILNAGGGATYMWAGPNDFLGTSAQINIPYASLENEGLYTVTVTDFSGNCSDTISLYVIVLNNEPIELIIPNVFTPNGDGINDVFEIKANSDIPSFNCIIFNRWGKLVYEYNSISDNWNGLINNTPATEGVYYFIVSGKNQCNQSFQQHGFINLFR